MFSLVAGNLLFFIVVANEFGLERFGYFAFAFSVANLLNLLVGYGYPQRILRDGNTPELGSSLNCASGLLLKLLIFSLIGGAILVASLIYDIEPFFIILFFGFSIGSFGDYFGSYSRAVGNHLVDSINLAVSSLVMLAGLGLLTQQLTEVSASIAFLFAKVVYFAFSAITAFRAGTVRMSINDFSIKTIVPEIRAGFPYFIDYSLVRLYVVIDTILVRVILGDTAVGLYQSGNRLLQGFFPVVQGLNNVFLPKFSYHWGKTWPKGLVKLFVSINFGLTVSCLVFFFAIAPRIIPILFGPQFSEILQSLWMFGVYGALRIISGSLGIYLTAIGGQLDRVKSNIICLSVLALSMVALGNVYDLSGVLASLAISNLVLALIYSRTILEYHRRLTYGKESL